MHVYATSLNESNIRVTRFNSPTFLHFIFAYKDIHFCKYIQHVKPEHDGFFSFFTGNQRDNCPIKYISKNVEMSVFIMGGNVLILTRVEMS